MQQRACGAARPSCSPHCRFATPPTLPLAPPAAHSRERLHAAARTAKRRAGCGRAGASGRHSSSSAPPLLTMEEVRAAAEARGLRLELSSFGPFFKVTATTLGEREAEPGFAAPPPFGVLHLDSVRVYNSRLRGPLRTRAQTAFGLALLVGAVAFVHADALGCTRAELLAIDDGDDYAQRLVSYYKRIGFTPIREVGLGGLRDLPDLLVWGGAGTRMDADVQILLRRWTRALRRAPAAEPHSKETAVS